MVLCSIGFTGFTGDTEYRCRLDPIESRAISLRIQDPEETLGVVCRLWDEVWSLTACEGQSKC